MKGVWGDGDYYGEITYRLNCWEDIQKGIPIENVTSEDVISEEVTPETKVSTSNKSRPPISVLLSDPEKKQKHIIEMH
ncbi:hypothetical protein Glove_181g11 [Diversispora epigaea]|uniref:Uncharacterized protein n=1 Tax=Diversispora epigaea TaxID=1348612 RepID=A0A397IN03_9GLOM|nr:hypothetical protein Glove_181g11 [Diversispora epigaea]